MGHYPTDNTLEVDLTFIPAPGSQLKLQRISFYINHYPQATGTFLSDTSDISFSIISDTMSFGAFPGGVLTITKFDTVNNLVSGTFHFIAYLAYPVVDRTVQDTVVNGSFTDVPISEGSYGQGTISADVDGFHMSSKGKSNEDSNGDNAAAYTAKEYGVFAIHCVSNDGASGNREISLNVVSPVIGKFSLAGTAGPNGVHAATYQWWDEHTGDNSEMTATTGTLTITKFDENTRRMSGTFSFSNPTGDTTHVTNGVIDNVQWSVF